MTLRGYRVKTSMADKLGLGLGYTIISTPTTTPDTTITIQREGE